ncbi:hypothetical protein Thiosp_00042 [Thiorhodovibrio litoralis]|nr:hypothetical protein Thiosp_00042 [Thiorhodovibrio litoralis]
MWNAQSNSPAPSLRNNVGNLRAVPRTLNSLDELAVEGLTPPSVRGEPNTPTLGQLAAISKVQPQHLRRVRASH